MKKVAFTALSNLFSGIQSVTLKEMYLASKSMQAGAEKGEEVVTEDDMKRELLENKEFLFRFLKDRRGGKTDSQVLRVMRDLIISAMLSEERLNLDSRTA